VQSVAWRGTAHDCPVVPTRKHTLEFRKSLMQQSDSEVSDKLAVGAI
jgi:hypothetical protein